jgi:hypothetical protein
VYIRTGKTPDPAVHSSTQQPKQKADFQDLGMLYKFCILTHTYTHDLCKQLLSQNIHTEHTHTRSPCKSVLCLTYTHMHPQVPLHTKVYTPVPLEQYTQLYTQQQQA